MAHPAPAARTAPAAQHLAGQPFSTLGFIARPGSRRRRYWAPPRASTYAQASAIGAECGAQLVAWLKANPAPEGEALAIWTLLDAHAGTSLVSRGYRAGLVAQIARAISGRALITTEQERSHA